jgi:hypothetical protein
MVDLHHIGNVDEVFAVDHRSGDRVVGATVSLPQLLCERPRIRVFARFAVDSPLEGDGFEPSVPREGPTRRDGFIRLSSGGSEAHHRRSAISTARSGRRSPPGPEILFEAEKQLAERALATGQQPMNMPRLRRSGPVNCVRRQRAAFQNDDLLEIFENASFDSAGCARFSPTDWPRRDGRLGRGDRRAAVPHAAAGCSGGTLLTVPRVLSADLQRQPCRRSSECHGHRLGRRRRRKAVFCRGADKVVPANISDVRGLVASGWLPIDIVLLQVSGPNDAGRYNAGLGIEHLQAAIGRARLVIAQVNPELPWTYGDTVIEPEVIDILVPAAEPPLELPARPAGPIETTGQYSAPYYRSEGVGPGAYIIAVQSGPDECTRLAA